MKPEEILEIANSPDVPTFSFGSEKLEDWTRQHRNQFTGQCIRHSGWYVVIHRSHNRKQRPDFRVLSSWMPGHRVPFSYDVPPSNPLERIESAVTARLLQVGWCGRWTMHETALARKLYLTAVGYKQALVYLEDWPNSNVAVLTGDYWSEGRNILESLRETISVEADGETICRQVDRFVAQLDAKVAESYAMKLLRPHLAQKEA